MDEEVTQHEWELNRENIRPLRSGRDVHSINKVFIGRTASIAEAYEKFENDLKEADSSEDPVVLCNKYVAWFEENFPSGRQSHMRKIISEFVNRFGSMERYADDKRMLKLWLKLVDYTMDSNLDALFERAFTSGIFRRLSLFHLRWAELREDAGDIDGARKALRRGIDCYAEPTMVLADASNALEVRQIRNTLNLKHTDVSEDDDIDEKRIAFGQLSDVEGKTPAMRISTKVGDGLSFRRHAAYLPNSDYAEKFSVFEGDRFKDEETGGSVDRQENLTNSVARVVIAENTGEPAKWKDVCLSDISFEDQLALATFNVFDELRSERVQNQKKLRTKVPGKMLIVDKDLSVEERLANLRMIEFA